MKQRVQTLLLGCATLGVLGFSACKKGQDAKQTAQTLAQSGAASLLKDPSMVQVLYPKTKMIEQVDSFFGTAVADPYRWLEGNPDYDTTGYEAWLDAQDRLAENYVRAIPQRQALKKRLTEVFDYERYSSPFKEGDYYYYYKNTGLQNQSVLYRTKDLNSEGEVVLDPNSLSEDGTTALNRVYFDKDAKYMAYSFSEGGSDWQSVQIIELETKKLLNDRVDWMRYSGISWYKDGFYYSRYAANEGGDKYTRKNEFHQVYYHKLGTSQEEDQLIFLDRGNPKRNFGAGVTEDEELLIVYTSETTSGNGILYQKLASETKSFESLIDEIEADYGVIDHKAGKLLVRTNKDAPNYRLIEIDLEKPEANNWKELLPEDKKRVLNSVRLINNLLVTVWTSDVQHILELYSLDGKKIKSLPMPEPGSIGLGAAKKDDKEIFVSFSSFTRPFQLYRLDLEKQELSLWKEGTIANFDANTYEAKQVFYKSKDGTEIPMFLIHKKGLALNGLNPTLLYGYGGFNISIMPSFSPGRLPFLENGGIYAIANIRGGGEYGKAWHKAGTLLQKQNVFDDFIAAAEYLIAQKYTSSEKIAIEGRSNGGLLVGTCMTQRPELFKVALPGVGVLDMLRYQHFTIGRAWAADYGLSEDEAQFKALFAYSPLHNIKETSYPATLITTADRDDRVVPAHSFKFAAALQAKQQGKNPIILRLDRKAGHGAGKPTEKRIEEEADKWSFVFYHLRMN